MEDVQLVGVPEQFGKEDAGGAFVFGNMQAVVIGHGFHDEISGPVVDSGQGVSVPERRDAQLGVIRRFLIHEGFVKEVLVEPADIVNQGHGFGKAQLAVAKSELAANVQDLVANPEGMIHFQRQRLPYHRVRGVKGPDIPEKPVLQSGELCFRDVSVALEIHATPLTGQ